MTEIVFILPDKNGWEQSSGEERRISCQDTTTIQQLHDIMRTELGKQKIRLSLEHPSGDISKLAAFDPNSDKTVATEGLAGNRILVGTSGGM